MRQEGEDAELPDDRVTVGPATKVRGPLFWGAVVVVFVGALNVGIFITRQDSSDKGLSAVQADVQTKASNQELKALAVAVATKAEAAELKDLASKVVTKEVFDAVTDDFKNRFEALAKANDRLASELADARREAAENSRRQEDLIRELSKRP